MAEFVRFQTTMWAVLRRAKDRSRRAVEDIVGRYRPPIVAFLRNRGFPPEDAEDLAQEVFLQVVKDDLLAKADAEKGRFRSLLLGVTRNVVRMERRRRAAAAPVPEPEEPADEDFDRAWVWNLVGLALERLKEEHPDYHAALRLQADENLERAEIARRLGRGETDVRNALHRGRQALSRLVREAIAEYCSSPDEYEAEIRYLTRFLQA